MEVHQLKLNLDRSLMPVFGSSEFIFVTDEPKLLSWLRGHDIETYLLDSVGELPKPKRKNVVLLPTTGEGLSFFKLERFFKSSRLLIVPLVAFDPSFEAAVYTVNLLGVSDFEQATKENAKWVSLLEGGEFERLVFKGACGELEMLLKERVDLMLPRMEPALLPGEWEAVGMFFEVAMIPDNEDFFHPGYIVNGELEVSGVAVAHHRVMPKHLTYLPTMAWELLGSLAREGGFPLRVKIENSQLKEVRSSNGVDLTDKIRDFSNRELELMLVEMAISNNPGLDLPKVDWRVNSVLNEGIRGIHFAVGDGVTGAHIDFICPGMECSPS
ncbi:hypothetical protein CSW23_02625 [Thermus scotoductus]|jgi:hypothetical protein|uniref:Crocagin biosynthetic protein CgnE/B domain-containing protein n=1 Tax=Thermus scotoductus TaxID=37636 RepID=A0A430V5V2_THESC|nr:MULTISPECIES: hypothetical protein [Thermus]RTH05241.1 hypothetical protein CSW50_00715 [Thermus scotoductus]RTH26628.1 hypothetical protein CSW40_04555 [Thermus scotoductus]RTI01903.1 hypothetical protein CSW31_02775 [Thermus scotoductus]RTI17907.1 hypothetical protein CSW27_00740 [Thermus scotoductus]RTI19820.1 hypothetical protein CSW23_02625 [Thermus scotoductus]